MDCYTKKVCARVKQPDGHYGPAVWALVGAGPEDQERIGKASDKALQTSIKAPRDQGRHRYYWALLGKVRENLPEPYDMSLETLHDVVKMGAGCTRVVRLPNNVLYELPGSIAFGAMEEGEFREFMDRALAYIVRDLVPGMDSAALENEVLEMMR